jgi:hypothetical protein
MSTFYLSDVLNLKAQKKREMASILLLCWIFHITQEIGMKSFFLAPLDHDFQGVLFDQI